MFEDLIRRNATPQEPPENMRCINCSHFRNSPEYLEETIKGLSTMSSGHASVRMEDGICEKNDEYLSAYDWCDKFESKTS